MRKFVCGSDGRSYTLQRFEFLACESDGKLTKVHDGKCVQSKLISNQKYLSLMPENNHKLFLFIKIDKEDQFLLIFVF